MTFSTLVCDSSSQQIEAHLSLSIITWTAILTDADLLQIRLAALLQHLTTGNLEVRESVTEETVRSGIVYSRLVDRPDNLLGSRLRCGAP